MPAMLNLSNEGITIMRWRLLPKSRIWIDPQGRRVSEAPAYLVYSDQAKSLAGQGLVKIEGYTPPSTESASPGGTVDQPPERREKKPRKLDK